MAENNEHQDSKMKEFKKPMIIVAVLLLGLLLFIAYRMKTNRHLEDASTVAVPEPTEQFANKTLDTEVLSDEKFKELKAIPKYEGEAVTDDISEDELAKVKRRYSNPFKPF